MDLERLEQQDEHRWRIAPHGAMRVPGIIYASREQVSAMDDRVYDQLCNVCALPGIVGAAYAMPDAHWGYGFPIGGVAAFDEAEGGVVSAGGVGFDISCGVRTLQTGLPAEEVRAVAARLADELFRAIPAGVGSRGAIVLDETQMDEMLEGGARWAVARGYGEPEDLERIEEGGSIAGARAEHVSPEAKQRQAREMGTLGSGNHYLEVQQVVEIDEPEAARAFALSQGEAVISIHCGSRGLGHQVGTDYLREMLLEAPKHGLKLPDRELACAPIRSPLGQRYLGAMRAAMNCALANRQIITHLARRAVQACLPNARLRVLYDVSHNICKLERHRIGGEQRQLHVHRKGATRAFGPGSPDVPQPLRAVGQPVMVGGSMGTASYILAGTEEGEARSMSSACHGAGRAMSRSQARKRFQGAKLVRELEQRGILIRSPSMRGVAEEAPQAYKDVDDVVEATEQAGLARKVARLEPMICIKG